MPLSRDDRRVAGDERGTQVHTGVGIVPARDDPDRVREVVGRALRERNRTTAGAPPDRLEPLWRNGHAKAVPTAPRSKSRRGAFDYSKLGGGAAAARGCHTGLHKSREHMRMWCP